MIHRSVLLTLVLAVVGSAAEPVSRPNLVVLLADDLGYGELGCYGGQEIPTPHLDVLAQSGIRFTQGYVTASYCAASRAGLLTGRYQTRFGFERNPIGPQNEDPRIGLPVDQRTLANYLRDCGYATGLIGKWHLGGTAAYHPQRRGFDEFFGFLHEGHYFVPPPWSEVTTWLRRKALPDGTTGRWTSEDGRVVWSTHLGYHEPDYDANNPILRGSQPVAESEYLTTAFTREACDFITRHRGQPFFLLLSYNAVHSPMQATDAAMQRFGHLTDIQRRIFAGMLWDLDESVGQVIAKLDEAGLRDNTLVVFLSDNGGPTRELTSSNHPLRGEKGSLYEGGIRVPFLMAWPQWLPAGQVDARPVSALDLLPTLLAAAGSPLPAADLGDGVNLLPFLSGQNVERPHDCLYWRMSQRAALRLGDWKLVRRGDAASDSTWQLFDLSTDVAEQHDRAADHPQQLERMVQMWQRLDQPMVEPRW